MPDPITALAAGSKALSIASKAEKGISFARKLYVEYLEKKQQEWWDCVVRMYEGRHIEETKDDIESRLHDLDSRDRALKVISHSHKSLMDAIDDSVLPALAAITAEYIALDRGPDGFYRGVCRTLCDLSFEEFEDLKKLTISVENVIDDLEREYGSIAAIGLKFGGEIEGIKADGISENGKPTSSRTISQVGHFMRLMHLIRSNGLGSEYQLWGGQLIQIRSVDLRHLGRLIR